MNQSEYEGEGFGISGGYGYQNDGPNNPKGTNPTQTETVNLPDGSHSVNKNVGYGKDKDSKSSVTQSGIGTGNIKVTDNEKQKELTGQTAEEAAKGIESNLTTETVADNSGALENIFDKDKVQAEIDLQVKVRQQFDRTRQTLIFIAKFSATSSLNLGRFLVGIIKASLKRAIYIRRCSNKDILNNVMFL